MRRKSLLLLVFLLFLYMTPSLTSATEYEASDQSITSFAETLPDDVLFYPDAFQDGTIELAVYGEDQDENYDPDYVKTQALDDDPFTEVGIDIEIWFEKDVGIEGFSYASYLYATSQDDCNIGFWNFDTTSFDNFEEPLPTSYDWMNGSVTNTNYWNATHIGCQLSETGLGDANFFWDYAELTLWKMTLADEDHYAESFANVSDWEDHNLDTYDVFSSDGDLLIFENNWAGGTDSDYIKTNEISGSFEYIEIRYRLNTTSVGSVVLAGYSVDDLGGDNQFYQGLTKSTSWTTTKFYDNNAPLECIAIMLQTTSVDAALYVDYLRISPANETGWQHDGSTTAGTYETGGVAISTDGDKLTFTADAESEYGHILFDTTATAAAGENTYYPFLYWNIYSATDNDADNFVYNIRLVGAGGSRYLGQSKVTGDVRYNVLSDTAVGDFNQWRIYVDNGDSVVVDFVQYYSIANFTVTQSGVCDTDDYLYVTDDVLWSGGGLAYPEYMTLNYDPVLSVSISQFSIWNITSNFDDPTEYEDLYFYATVDSVETQEGYDETSGSYSNTGALTDIRFGFKTAGISISEISFLSAIPQWNILPTAILIFAVELYMGTLNGLLILLGLIMIPTSTLYLAYGVKHDRSSDRLFYGLIIFFLGCGLFIGGILP